MEVLKAMDNKILVGDYILHATEFNIISVLGKGWRKISLNV